MRGGLHHHVARSALTLRFHRWRDVLVANEEFGIGRGRFFGVMDAEALRMERRLDVSGMADWSLQAASCIGVASSAVRHPEFGGDAFGRVVTFHAIQHPRQGKVRETVAPGDRIVTGSAIDAELLLDLEMRDVRELHVDIFPGHPHWAEHATVPREAWLPHSLPPLPPP